MAEINHRIGIKVEPGVLYAALSEQDGLSAWWTTDTKAEAKQGAILEFRFGGGGPDMKVTELLPERRVAWECVASPHPGWQDTKLVFEIQAGERETVLRFSHQNWKEVTDFMAHCSMKWATFLLSLKDYLETGSGRPFPHDLQIDSPN